MTDETPGTNGRDPTANTRALIGDAVVRINDVAEVEIRRITELAAAETRRVNELTELRDRYEEKLAVAEASRLNANRTMDENSRTVDREKVAAQAALLATDVKATAETARLLVAQTKEEQAKNLSQQLNPILEQLAVLNQARFQGVGERRVADPAQMQLESDVRELLSRKEKAEGRAGLSTPILMLISGSGVGLLVFLIQQALTRR